MYLILIVWGYYLFRDLEQLWKFRSSWEQKANKAYASGQMKNLLDQRKFKTIYIVKTIKEHILWVKEEKEQEEH